ncbi:unnamed protein product, partial [Ilex paraguariensis]
RPFSRRVGFCPQGKAKCLGLKTKRGTSHIKVVNFAAKPIHVVAKGVDLGSKIWKNLGDRD